MFTTSLAAAAVVGVIASSSLSTQPEWATSYATALAQAAELRKPVAVFITNGGLAHLTNGEGIGSDASTTLRTHYIAVQIDATTDAGKKMAEAFRVQEGVVISDTSGGQIALRHEGTVGTTDLNGYLTKYATPQTITTTEYRSTVVRPVETYRFENRPVLNAVQNFNTAVFGQPLLPSFGGS